MKRSYVVIGLLVLLFAAPGIVAYMVYLHPGWISARTNRGQLLQPPLLLQSKNLSEKWQLLYWSPTDCTDVCAKRMDDLARIRLALGRRLYYVDLVLAMKQPASTVSKAIQHQLRHVDGRMIRFGAHDATLLGVKPAVYLINPTHYAILVYSQALQDDDIFQDLKKMVKDK